MGNRTSERHAALVEYGIAEGYGWAIIRHHLPQTGSWFSAYIALPEGHEAEKRLKARKMDYTRIQDIAFSTLTYAGTGLPVSDHFRSKTVIGWDYLGIPAMPSLEIVRSAIAKNIEKLQKNKGVKP